ncbi:MAG TPA: RHS repeat-associated core domain-containing protein [Chthoniobacterales bacterium]|nr:RHS repeat-associated core domain-containing protein [Chthoniobacterales bacterium]
MALLLLSLIHVARGESVTLDDHGTGPCWWNDYPNRGDTITMHLTVVTGNVWNHDDTNPLLDLRLSYDGGTEDIGGFYIPLGAPAGTVVADFDYTHGYPFCSVPADKTHIFGFPNGVYISDTGRRRGDAAGSGLVITYTNSGDCGPTGGGCGIDKTSPSQVWTIWDGPAHPTPTPLPTPKANTKKNDKKEGGNQKGPCLHMARYSVHSMLVSLNIVDTPLNYSPPRGDDIAFTVTYNQKESQQPETFNYSNLGPKWTFDWLSYVTDDPNAQFPLVSLYMSGGGAEIYPIAADTLTFAPDPQSHAVLVKTGPDSYERRSPDGSKQIYGLSDSETSYPRRIFMTKIIDSIGNTVSVGYDASFRVTTIADSLGQITTISYQLAGDPLKITKVTDPFGRFATFQYAAGKLTTITDRIGIQSQFTYLAGTDSIDSLTTPYGTTTFVSGEDGISRWIETTDPLGGKERVEYRDQAPGIAPNDPVGPTASGITNSGLDFANTFYWDKRAMLLAPGDYSKAKISHWLSDADGSVSGTLSSEKLPLENRVWYTYAGQPDYQHTGPSANPSQIARVLADGSTQLSQFEYNSLGKPTKTVDPAGRTTSFVYAANNIDLLEVRQTTGASNELQRKFTYNGLHEPLTETDAAGQVTTRTYNAQGQLLTSKNARNEVTTYAYGGAVPAGCLASITSPSFNGVSAVTNFTYDSFKRVRTVTDTDNYTVTTVYDNFDRKTKVTYPDSTFEQFQYTDNVTGTMTLDLTGSRDRRGLWTYQHYNGNQQMDSITDPANRTTLYNWCTCGALAGITDPKGQTTTFNRDIQSRVYQKVFQDGTTIDYLYDGQTAPNTAGATSRLQSFTDAKSQRTNYLYFADDTVRQISYTNLAGQPLSPPTPSVNYTYDPNYNRIATMVDGVGTTTYAYNPVTVPAALGAGQLASVDGPLANDTITFGYDQLGRVTNRSINGAANSETWTFDNLGRVSTDVNKLGTFNLTYVGVTNRLSKVAYPGGASANYLYFPNSQDKRLQEIKNLNDDKHPKKQLISQFDYTYDAEGQVTSWTRNLPDLPVILRADFGYDNADQLVSAPLRNASNNTLLIPYSYGYDLASNRTSETVGTTATISTPNNVNEIISQSGGVNRTLTYDPNGSITSDGGTRTFEWDGANRLVAINYTGQNTRSEFSYDGLNRVAKIVEKTGGTINSTRKFVWSGQEKCEFRDANDAVTLRVYAQGQHNGTTPSFFTRDHLGSVREVFTGGGSVAAQYEYDPYGRTATISGTASTDFGFTGLYRHSRSNLNLATYRAYDPELGRWLNRDPIEEEGGPNLYAYVSGNPGSDIDPSGLFGAKEAYNDWLNIAAAGLTRGGLTGYAQTEIGIAGMTAIDFWDARTLETNAERSGAAAGAGCVGDAWKYGGLAAGQILWASLGSYALNNVLHPFYRFLGPGSRAGFGTGTWLTRGLIGKIPFGSIANARSMLQIPTKSAVNEVVVAKNVWWRYIAGPRAATKFPKYGVGGGAEYRVGGWRGE